MRDISDVTDIEKLIKKIDSISDEEEIGAVQRITYVIIICEYLMLPKERRNSENIKTEVILSSQIGQGIISLLLDKLNVGHAKKKISVSK